MTLVYNVTLHNLFLSIKQDLDAPALLIYKRYLFGLYGQTIADKHIATVLFILVLHLAQGIPPSKCMLSTALLEQVNPQNSRDNIFRERGHQISTSTDYSGVRVLLSY